MPPPAKPTDLAATWERPTGARPRRGWRRHTCQQCGHRWDEAGTTGRKPTACPPCDPQAHHRRAYQRALTARNQLERALVAELDRLTRTAPQSRAELVAATRRVAWATGRHATADALVHLAAVALAWAGNLRATTEPDLASLDDQPDPEAEHPPLALAA